MLRQRGYPGSAVQVSRAVRHLRPAPPSQAYLRLSTLTGEVAQADWGSFGAQIQPRNNQRLQAAIRSSRLPAVKQLRDFDLRFSCRSGVSRSSACASSPSTAYWWFNLQGSRVRLPLRVVRCDSAAVFPVGATNTDKP